MAISWKSPLSLYSIPVVWFLAFYPHNAKFRLIASTVGFNNLQPRSNVKLFKESPAIDQEIKDRAERLEGAHQNGNEILPLWIGAVLAGNQVGLSNETLNTVSAAFISLRLLYNYVYINQASAGVSWMRTGLWFSGLSLPLYLLIKAANFMSSRG